MKTNQSCFWWDDSSAGTHCMPINRFGSACLEDNTHINQDIIRRWTRRNLSQRGNFHGHSIRRWTCCQHLPLNIWKNNPEGFHRSLPNPSTMRVKHAFHFHIIRRQHHLVTKHTHTAPDQLSSLQQGKKKKKEQKRSAKAC